MPESEAGSTFPVFGDAGACVGAMTGNTCFPYTPDRDRIGPTNTGLAKTENTVGLAEYAETPTDRFSDRPFLGLCVPGGQFVTSGQQGEHYRLRWRCRAGAPRLAKWDRGSSGSGRRSVSRVYRSASGSPSPWGVESFPSGTNASRVANAFRHRGGEGSSRPPYGYAQMALHDWLVSTGRPCGISKGSPHDLLKIVR